MPKISLSYRRSDSAATAGRIFDRLVLHYGQSSVFMDIDAIPLGADFRAYIDDALRSTDVLLIVIGPKWLGDADEGAGVSDRHDEHPQDARTPFATGTILCALYFVVATPLVAGSHARRPVESAA